MCIKIQDLQDVIKRFFNIYRKINNLKAIKPGLGQVLESFKTNTGRSIFYAVIGPPTQKIKGKKKKYDKILAKSIKDNKIILPKDSDDIFAYLFSVFPSIIKPRNQIMETQKRLLAGLRLNFVPIHNIKYSFKDQRNPQILLYETIINNQFAFYLSIIDLIDDGLYLSHEKQIKYISEKIEDGINPLDIKNLPDLRTGETDIQINKSSDEKKENDHASIKKFREKIQFKKKKEEIKEELDFETVISFPSIKSKNEIKNSDTIEKSITSPNPTPKLKPKPKQKPNLAINKKPKPKPKQKPNLAINKKPKLTPKQTPNLAINKKPKPKQKPVIKPVNHSISNIPQEIIIKVEKYDKLLKENDLIKNQLKKVTNNLTFQLENKNHEFEDMKNKIKSYEKESKEIINSKDEEISHLSEKISDLKKIINEFKETYEGIKNLNQKKIKNQKDTIIKLKDKLKESEKKRSYNLKEKINLEILITDLQEKNYELIKERKKLNEVKCDEEFEEKQIKNHINEIIKERESILKKINITKNGEEM